MALCRFFCVRSSEDAIFWFCIPSTSSSIEPLYLGELSSIPRWTIRIPRNRQLTARTNKPKREDLTSEIEETARAGQMNGDFINLHNQGSIYSTGLLAPGRQCLICLMVYNVGDEVLRLPSECQHIFHTKCIDPWLLHR